MLETFPKKYYQAEKLKLTKADSRPPPMKPVQKKDYSIKDYYKQEGEKETAEIEKKWDDFARLKPDYEKLKRKRLGEWQKLKEHVEDNGVENKLDESTVNKINHGIKSNLPSN